MKGKRPEEAGQGRVSPTAPASKSLSHSVWKYLEAQPGFNEGMAEARRELASGQGTPFKEVKSRR